MKEERVLPNGNKVKMINKTKTKESNKTNRKEMKIKSKLKM
jgi:hypothetical protein